MHQYDLIKLIRACVLIQSTSKTLQNPGFSVFFLPRPHTGESGGLGLCLVSSLFIQNNAYASVWLDQIDQGVRVGTTHRHTHTTQTHTHTHTHTHTRTHRIYFDFLPRQMNLAVVMCRCKQLLVCLHRLCHFCIISYHYLSNWLSSGRAEIKKYLLTDWLGLGIVFPNYDMLPNKVRSSPPRRESEAFWVRLDGLFECLKCGFLGQKFRKNFSFWENWFLT